MGLLDNFKQTDASKEHQVKTELEKCQSLNEMFVVLNKHYNLDTKIPAMLKPITVSKLTQNIKSITTFLSIKER